MVNSRSSERGSSSVPPAKNSKGTSSPKKRHWGRRLLILVVLLVVMVGVLPYLVSTGPGERLAVSLANTFSGQKIQLTDLSLNWFGPIEVTALKVSEADGAEMLAVERIKWSRGLWGALTSAEKFDELQVDSPRVTVKTEDLFKEEEKEKEEKEEKKEEPAKKPAKRITIEPRGQLVLTDGTVRIRRDDGHSYEVSAIQAEVKVAGLNDITGNWSLQLPGEGGLAGAIQIEQMITDEQFQWDGAKGTVRAQSEKAIDLGALVEFLRADASAGGTAQFRLEAAFDKGDVNSDFELDVTGLQAGYGQEAAVNPIDVQLKGKVRTTGKKIDGQVNLAGQFGAVDAKFGYLPSETPLDLSTEKMVGALLEGERVNFPDFELTSSGKIDVAVLAHAVPALMNVRGDLNITGGTIEIQQVAAQGGDTPTARVVLASSVLTGSRNGQTMVINPIKADFDVTVPPGSGLQIRQALLESDFIKLSGFTRDRAVQMRFEGDLDGVQEQMATIFSWERTSLKGLFSGQIDLAQHEDEVTIELDVSTTELTYGQGDEALQIRAGRVQHSGELQLVDRRFSEYRGSALQLTMGDILSVHGSGWYRNEGQAFHAELAVDQAHLKELGAWAQQLGMDQGAGYEGLLALQVEVDRASAKEAITSKGSGSIRDFRVQAKEGATAGTDVEWKWSGLAWQPEQKDMAVAVFEVDSSALKASGKNIAAHYAGDMKINGELAVESELAESVPVVAQMTGWKDAPAAAGHFQWAGACRSTGETVAVTGKGGITNLSVGRGDQAFREPKVEMVNDWQWNLPEDRLELRQTDLISEMVSVWIKGSIAQLRSQQVLQLSGRYRGSWDRIVSLVHQLYPDTQEKVMVKGVTESEFVIQGPARQPEWTPVFRGVESQVGVGWESAEVYGLKLGAARFMPTLKEGRVSVAPTAITTGAGKLNVGGLVDLGPSPATLQMQGKHRWLENVAANVELGQYFLSWFNPIFGDLTRLEGLISMDTEDIVLPLGQQVTQSGSGRGTIHLQDMKVQPAGIFGDLFQLTGLPTEKLIPVHFSDLNFRIEKGRIYYEDFAVKLAELMELEFAGSVGFDETVDMAVSLPLRPPLLEKLGVKLASLPLNMDQLLDVKIRVPIMGSRLKPSLDFGKVNVSEILQGALKKTIEKPGDTIFDILKPKKSETPKEPEKETEQPNDQRKEEPEPQRSQPEEILQDILFDLLQNQKQQK